MRVPRPWLRKQTRSWCVTLGGVQYSLGKDKDAALEKYAELLKAHGRGEIAHDPALYDLLNLYLAWVKTNRPPSFEKLQVHLKRFGQKFKRLKVSQLKVHHVQAVIDSDYAKRSTTYQNDAITTVKGALFWAMDQGYITVNPIARMKKPPRNVRETFVKAVDWQAVLDAASDLQFRDYLTVAFSSGARPHEMRTMEASYLDGRRIVFPRLRSKGKKRQRVIYLDELAWKIVERLVVEYPTGPIFRNRRGKPWTKDAIKNRFTRLREKLEVPGLCATVLRHSYAHHKLTSGTDSLIVSKLLGHTDGRMLALRYGHLESATDLLSAAARQDNPLSASASKKSQSG